MSVTEVENRTPEEQQLLDTIWQYWEAFAQGDIKWKFDVMDMDDELHSLAYEYLRRYDGDFEYLVDLKSKGQVPSLNQAKGILNTAVAGIKREKGLAGKRRVVDFVPNNGFYRTLKDEMYMRIADWKKAEAGTRVISILTDVKPKMKWQGVAAIRPDLSYSVWNNFRGTEVEERVSELLASDADLEAMQIGFAKALNRCATCGKTLTVPTDKFNGRCASCGTTKQSPAQPSPNGVRGVKLDEVSVPF